MNKETAGAARGVKDASLGDLDLLLDPSAVARELLSLLRKDACQEMEPPAVETVRWKPGQSLAVSWCVKGPGGAPERFTSKTFAEPARAALAMEKAGTRSLVETAQLRARALSRDGRTILLAFPNDRQLPGLPRVVNPARAKHVAQVAVDARQVPLDRVRERGTSIEVVRYKPGRRCVLRFDARVVRVATEESRRVRFYGRTLPSAAATRLAEALTDPRLVGLPMARFLGMDGDTSTLFFEEVAGSPLDETLARPEFHAAAGAALASFHRGPVPRSAAGGRFEERVHLTIAEARELAAVDARLGRAIDLALDAIPGGGGSARRVLVHGDFHPGQCLVEGGEARFVDLDNIAVDDPARDAGHYLSALAARRVAGMVSTNEERAAREAFLDGYGVEPVDTAREEALALVQHALSPLRRLEALGVERALALLDLAKRASASRGTAPRADSPRQSLDGPREWLSAALTSRGAAAAAEPIDSARIVRASARDGGKAEVELAYRTRSGSEGRVFGILEGRAFREVGLDPSLGAPAIAEYLRQAGVPDAEGTWDIRVLAHRPERRATLLLSTGDGPRYVLRWSRSARLARRAAIVAESARQHPRTAAELPYVAPIHADAPTHRALYPFVKGLTLADLLRGGPGFDPAAVVRAVSRFHALEPFDSVPARGFEDELRNLDTIRRRLAECGWDAAASWERTRGILSERLPRIGAAPPVWLHRDLYEQQILTEDSGACRIIDLDTAAPGDAAIDVGNFIAHLDLAAFEGARRDRVNLLTDRLSAIQCLDRRALEWCVAAAHARLALVHAPRPAGAEVASYCLTRAGAWLAGGAVPSRVS